MHSEQSVDVNLCGIETISNQTVDWLLSSKDETVKLLLSHNVENLDEVVVDARAIIEANKERLVIDSVEDIAYFKSRDARISSTAQKFEFFERVDTEMVVKTEACLVKGLFKRH